LVLNWLAVQAFCRVFSRGRELLGEADFDLGDVGLRPPGGVGVGGELDGHTCAVGPGGLGEVETANPGLNVSVAQLVTWNGVPLFAPAVLVIVILVGVAVGRVEREARPVASEVDVARGAAGYGG
jgi:hypothetical protein